MSDVTVSDEELAHIKGVAFNAPPAEVIPSIMDAMNKAFASLPEGANGALVGVIERDASGELTANAVIVTHLPMKLDGLIWAGKSWKSGVTYGAAIRKVW